MNFSDYDWGPYVETPRLLGDQESRGTQGQSAVVNDREKNFDGQVESSEGTGAVGEEQEQGCAQEHASSEPEVESEQGEEEGEEQGQGSIQEQDMDTENSTTPEVENGNGKVGGEGQEQEWGHVEEYVPSSPEEFENGQGEDTEGCGEQGQSVQEHSSDSHELREPTPKKRRKETARYDLRESTLSQPLPMAQGRSIVGKHSPIAAKEVDRREIANEDSEEMMIDQAHGGITYEPALLFHGIVYDDPEQCYPLQVLQIGLDTTFRLRPQNLVSTKIQLLSGNACLPKVRSVVKPALTFLKSVLHTDVLILLDAHSDRSTGLVTHDHSNDGYSRIDRVDQVLSHYIGPDIWKRLPAVAGIKGLFLLTCGAAFTIREHFVTGIIPLVETGKFDFIIGFSASSVQPNLVMPFMLEVVNEIYVNRTPVEEVFQREIPRHWDLLKHTPVVLVSKTDGARLISRRYILSLPPWTLWGLVPMCGNEECHAGPGNIKVNTPTRRKTHDVAKFKCNKCQWTSGYIARPGFLKPILPTHLFFYHDFPLSDADERYITWAQQASQQNTDERE
ncbi:hypothetical protein JVU11DRAFT_9182 [Chiua virens]|nr:hypothetical protein JVU11DRAFT_9182 [Chiua virens]